MTLKNGFTLIELLVVVLIIGILSAMALPQYEKAVLKARYTELQTLVSAYKTAAETYYLANGEYPSYWSDMDLTPPGSCTASDTAVGGSMVCSSKDISLDLYDGNNKNLVGFYKPNGKVKAAYVQWLDVSANPRQRECWALAGDSAAQSVCLGMGGTSAEAPSHFSCTQNGGCMRYILP